MRIDRSAAWMMLPMCIVVVSFALADVVSVKNDVSLECDVVVYGSSPAAISAAVQAKRMGRSVVVVSPESRIGGLTTGGLGATDIGNKAAFGGIALEFYRDVAAWYSNPEHWTHQRPEEYFPGGQRAGARGNDTMWTFEPSAALAILEGWEKRDGLDVRRGEWLDREKGVEKKAGRIVAIRTLSGRVYHGRVFIDATYEGDLMAAAGVSYHVGRESNATYGEKTNGNQPWASGAKHHNFHVGVSPYIVEGDRASGLLPGVERHDATESPGDGDGRVQAYCIRMCLTDAAENRIPFKKPKGYDERDYELLFREYAALEKNPAKSPPGCLDGRNRIPFIMTRMPNCKTDSNNRTAYSSDFIGANWRWPEASYAERREIFNAHLKYQQGLMWTLANHDRIPPDVREYFSRWGTCKDEFLDGPGDGWQDQLYVREARRMVGETVMTEHHCRGSVSSARPVAMGAYIMDSHHVRRIETADGQVRNEGNVEDGRAADGKSRIKPYGIDYGAILPKRSECENLIVPVCVSASHIAFGSIRMEPVFFALGQAAGTAAAMAAERNAAVHDVPYAALSARLTSDGQVICRRPQGDLQDNKEKSMNMSNRAKSMAMAAVAAGAIAATGPSAAAIAERPGSPTTIRVAAANSSDPDKRNADFVCSGTNDEAVLNKAIELLTRGGTLRLADGDYYIDAFANEGNTAVTFGFNGGRARTINVVGGTENKSYNTRFGVGIHVTKKAMDSMDQNGTYSVFCGTAKKPRARGVFFVFTFVNNVNFRDIYILFSDASKPVRGIDGSCFGNMQLEMVGVYTERYFNDRFLHEKPATPARGSIGVVSCRSSNDEGSRIGYDFVNVGGMHTGFLFQGVDHLVLRSCTAARCCYGYRTVKEGYKTMTWINCCDEGNTHLPFFGGLGHLTAIDFNIERFNAAYIPDSPDGGGTAAMEKKPGAWHGFVSYTMQGCAFGLHRFWQDGHGLNFRTENLDHSRSERPKWPEYLETYFDKRTNKTLTWNGAMWVDAIGNKVE